MIGLIDCEALSLKEPFIPNLEIMKLYNYHKKSQLTKLILSPDVLDAYTQIYLRRQFDTTPVPTDWVIDRPVKWGGLSFTNNIYTPMLSEIENTVPNYRVYSEYIKTMLPGHKEMLLDAEKYLDYSFIRLYNKNPICPKHINEGMPLLIFDDFLFQEDDYETRLAAISARQPSKISFLSTPSVESKEHLDALIKHNLIMREKPLGKRGTSLILNLDFNIGSFKSFLYQYQEYFKTFAKKKVLFPTHIPKDIYYLRQYIQQFERLVNLVYYSYTQGIPAGVIETWSYNEEASIITNVFASYVNNSASNDKTFYNYCIKRIYNKKIKTIMTNLYKNNPQLHYLFDVSLTYLLLGGTWYGQFRNNPTSKFY